MKRVHARKIRTCWRVGAGIVAALLVVVPSPAAAKEKKQVVERFRANAMDVDSARATIVEIGITEWSTEEERQALVQAFNDGGNEAAYKHLSQQKEKAYVRAGMTLGYQMRYAYQFKREDKRQIVLATDRPMSLGEVMTGAASQDNNISLVILQLNPETNTGEGQMVFGAEFKVNEKTGQLEIETLSMNPTTLSKVTAEKVKQKG